MANRAAPLRPPQRLAVWPSPHLRARPVSRLIPDLQMPLLMPRAAAARVASAHSTLRSTRTPRRLAALHLATGAMCACARSMRACVNSARHSTACTAPTRRLRHPTSRTVQLRFHLGAPLASPARLSTLRLLRPSMICSAAPMAWWLLSQRSVSLRLPRRPTARRVDPRHLPARVAWALSVHWCSR